LSACCSLLAACRFRRWLGFHLRGQGGLAEVLDRNRLEGGAFDQEGFVGGRFGDRRGVFGGPLSA
jgi:hypothetical protein